MAIYLINKLKLNLTKSIVNNSLNAFIQSVSLNKAFDIRLRSLSSDPKSTSIESTIESKLKSKLTFANCLPIPLGRRTVSSSAPLNTNGTPKHRKKVCVLGGGAWGTAVADLIGNNVLDNKHMFCEEVILYLRDDRLRLIIEKTRQNIRYLTQIKLPLNVRPVSSLSEAVSQSDILVFVIPHQFIHELCLNINESVIQSTRNPIGISLIKGLHIDSTGGLELNSQIIQRMLGIEVAVLSGANIAMEVARREYCESTLALNPCADDNKRQHLLRSLFECNHFKIDICSDVRTVEMCGALKNVVAIGCGLIDGLGLGMNTKAAAISCGLKEMVRFVQLFHPNCHLRTFFESCGIADVIASSFGGRNRRVSEELIKSNKTIEMLEKELLAGQKLQGPRTAHIVFQLLEKRQLLDEFPFFSAVHHICTRHMNPKEIISAIHSSY